MFKQLKNCQKKKKKSIQVLKKKLKVPGTQQVQLYELTVLQQEKDQIYQELMEFKGKILKLQKDKEDSKIERYGLVSRISSFNDNQKEEEVVFQELMSQPLIHNEDQVNKSPTDELSVSMSQINLREGEIKELKEGNVQLKHELDKIIE